MKIKSYFEADENLIFAEIGAQLVKDPDSKEKYFRVRSDKVPIYRFSEGKMVKTGKWYNKDELIYSPSSYRLNGLHYYFTKDGYILPEGINLVAYVSKIYTPPIEIVVTGQNVHIREKPMTTAKVVDKVSKNTLWKVDSLWYNLEEDHYWYRISTGAYKGSFISQKYAKPKEEFIQLPTPTPPAPPPSPSPPPSPPFDEKTLKTIAYVGIGVSSIILIMMLLKEAKK